MKTETYGTFCPHCGGAVDTSQPATLSIPAMLADANRRLIARAGGFLALKNGRIVRATPRPSKAQRAEFKPGVAYTLEPSSSNWVPAVPQPVRVKFKAVKRDA